jgi:hypothetical protein
VILSTSHQNLVNEEVGKYQKVVQKQHPEMKVRGCTAGLDLIKSMLEFKVFGRNQTGEGWASKQVVDQEDLPKVIVDKLKGKIMRAVEQRCVRRLETRCIEYARCYLLRKALSSTGTAFMGEYIFERFEDVYDVCYELQDECGWDIPYKHHVPFSSVWLY